MGATNQTIPIRLICWMLPLFSSCITPLYSADLVVKNNPIEKDKERSIFIYPLNREVIDDAIALCKNYNLDSLVPLTYYGAFLYETKVMKIGMIPKYDKFILKLTKDFTDPLKYLIAKAKENNLRVYPTFAAVRAPRYWGDLSIISRHSEWAVVPLSGNISNTDWANVHNQEYQDYFCRVIADFTSRYDVDGIDLDYIRVGDEAISFDEKTREQFKKRFGYDFHAFACGQTEISDPAIRVNFLTCPGIIKKQGRYVEKWIKWCDDLKIKTKRVENPPLDDLATVLIAGGAHFLDNNEIAKLVDFIEKGGKVIFLDSPSVALRESSLLRNVLGVETGVYWADPEVHIKSTADHFITKNLPVEIKVTMYGNSVKKVTTAKELASFVNMPKGMPGSIPAVTYTEYGKGRVILFNWVPVSQIYGFSHDLLRRSIAFLMGKESTIKEARSFGDKSYTDFFRDFQTFNSEALERFLIAIRKSIKNERTRTNLSAHVGSDVNLVTQGQNPPEWIRKGLLDKVRYMNYGGHDFALERATFHAQDVGNTEKIIESTSLIRNKTNIGLRITKMRELGISRFSFYHHDPFDPAQEEIFKELAATVFGKNMAAINEKPLRE